MLMSLSSIKNKYKIDITGLIHVGGHIGEEVSDYYIKGIDNIVIFEPLPQSFVQLESEVAKYQFKKIKLINKALGSKNKQIEMNVCNQDGLCSSLLNPKHVLEQYPHIKFPNKQLVDMITMDSIIEENHNYNFLNMDTQGYELEVLKGAKKTLKKINFVYTEVNNTEVYENNALIEDIDKFLEKYNMVRVETDWMGTTWGDAFYIKKDLI
jgi:FkbM family methyltransferase